MEIYFLIFAANIFFVCLFFKTLTQNQKHQFLTLPRQIPSYRNEKTEGPVQVKVFSLLFLLRFNYAEAFLQVTNKKGARTCILFFKYAARINT
jgi:hypothetical protein